MATTPLTIQLTLDDKMTEKIGETIIRQAMLELKERLEGAEEELKDLEASAWSAATLGTYAPDATRLGGKKEGVRLAISYIEEGLRA